MALDFVTEIEITQSREIHIKLPTNVPIGPATLSIHVSEEKNKKRKTLGDLLRSEFFGMWQQRSDITDGVTFAHHLRQTAWRRPQ